ncbi:unnamed protein product [Euphydryas editha]|uniref:Uncharacterized protein n=1 Tax=Euphydryas editha TaxID=104508 RepID=A0AAU9V4M0_EUPED|nr:unnamed protein product [Euphydryas editha]
MTDVSASVQDESKIVKTLRDNLCVIEDLYRECFYETAKQEELITMLRRSYLDMRLVDRQKTDQIDFLQNTLTTQKNSFDRYKDIAMEVENLKMEITNFLNNSANNDSGVWECEPVAELRDIADQLLCLQDLLRTDCICGLEEENKKLKQRNETMEIQIGELQRKLSELELALEDKENIDQKYQKQIEEKEIELHRIRQQLTALEKGTRDQGSACDTLTLQIKELENMLTDKTMELLTMERKVESQEATISNLREELHRANLIVTENEQVRAEVSGLSAAVSRWRAQLADSRRRLRELDAELRRARAHCRHLAALYREKACTAAALQAQLSEAQARGAALCAEAQRATRAVRRWLAAQRARRREQEDKIKEQEQIIQSLRSNERTNVSENEPCCSKYLSRVEARRSDHSSVRVSETDCSKYFSRVEARRSDRSVRASETTGCSKCAYSRLNLRTSESEAASPLPPTPPKRLLRKKPLCVERPCQCPLRRATAAQRPSRHDAMSEARASCELLRACRDTDTTSREESGADELLERVERAHEALAAAQRRWGTAGDD